MHYPVFMFLQPEEEGIKVQFGEIHTKENPWSNGEVIGRVPKQEYTELEDFLRPPWALLRLVVRLASQRDEHECTLGSACLLYCYCCLEGRSREQGRRVNCQNRFLFALLAETNSVGIYRKLLPQKEMKAYAKNTGKIHIFETDFFAKPEL